MMVLTWDLIARVVFQKGCSEPSRLRWGEMGLLADESVATREKAAVSTRLVGRAGLLDGLAHRFAVDSWTKRLPTTAILEIQRFYYLGESGTRKT